MAGRIETLFIPGPAGRLEALLEEGEGAPTHAWLVCHPHPLFHGTMHNKVVYRVARALRRSGAVVLRFNFRGVGTSEGKYDEGVGEVEDARACLEFLRARYPSLPYSLAGFSFGSRVILQLGAVLPEPKPVRLIPVGFPITRGNFDYMPNCTLPKFFVISTHDEYCEMAAMETLFATFPEPKSLQWIVAKDHFFVDALDELESTVLAIAKP